MNSSILLIVSSLLIGVVISDDACPKFDAVQNFNGGRYLGLWYEYAKLPNSFQGSTDKCVTAEYSLIDASTIKVNNTGYKNSPGLTVNDNAIGKAVQSGSSGAFTVNFENSRNPVVSTEPNYFVLDTDYDTYSLVYSCRVVKELGNKKFVSAWLLSRTKSLSNDVVDKLQGRLAALGVDLKALVKTNQNDC